MPTTLYRPVGLSELALIWESGCGAFPPRLPDQPTFYPVTSLQYATQIARDWNTKVPSFAGYVTCFKVDDDYLAKFERHVVGSAVHEEYWIPAAELPPFNEAIRGRIEVEAAFFGDSFAGFVPDISGFKGKNAEQQFVVLARSWDRSRMDFALEILPNRKAVYLNCLFWLQRDFSIHGITADQKASVLAGVIKAWKCEAIEPELPAGLIRAVLENEGASRS